MKKKSFVEKLADKAFAAKSVQDSWAIHEKMFGPILRPAFADDAKARVELTAALNKLSRNDLNGALQQLVKVQKSCKTDADKAAWLFFVGLCFERAGDADQMLMHYAQAAEYGHRFYLPYLQTAKIAYGDGVLDAAEENYRLAIEYFDLPSLEQSAENLRVAASMQTNLAACLTKMHRYDEAEQALDTAKALLPTQPGRAAVEAILRAAMGQQEAAEACLTATKAETPAVYAGTEQVVQEILEGTHPHFRPMEADAAAISAFWSWFAADAEEMAAALQAKEHERMLEALRVHLKPLVPFAEREPEFGIMVEESGFRVDLCDFYSRGVCSVYEALLAACPEAVQARWHFEIVR